MKHDVSFYFEASQSHDTIQFVKANENYIRMHGLSAMELASTVRATIICNFAISAREAMYEVRKRSFQKGFCCE